MEDNFVAAMLREELKTRIVGRPSVLPPRDRLYDG